MRGKTAPNTTLKTVMTIGGGGWKPEVAEATTRKLVASANADGPLRRVQAVQFQPLADNKFVIQIDADTEEAQTDCLYWYLMGAFDGMRGWE